MSFTRAAGMPPIMTVVEPFAIIPGPAGTQPGSMHGSEVSVTRAADELYLLYPTVEEGRDGPSRLMRPSQFLTELDHNPAVFDRWEIEEAPPDED